MRCNDPHDLLAQLFAPHDLALADPEVGPAACTEPYRRMERRITLLVDRDVPAWSNSIKNHHFEPMAAAARTQQSDTPILAIVTH